MSNFAERFRSGERKFEGALFSTRWLLAPFFAGLGIALVVLLIKFAGELVHVVLTAFKASEADVILGVLALVDLTLTGSLLVIVIFSGYENFVSKIDHSNHRDWPEWMGTIDFTALKLKLLSSIVAISAIQLLKQFWAIKSVSDRELWWSVGIHLVFVVSSVLLALSDWIQVKAKGGHAAAAPHSEKKSGTAESAGTPPAV